MNHLSNKIVIVLLVLIISSFGVGAYRVNQQASQINKIIEDQSPLIFSFENAGTVEPKITFVVTCIKQEKAIRYVCETEQFR